MNTFPIPKTISSAAQAFYLTAPEVPNRIATTGAIENLRDEIRCATSAVSEEAMLTYLEDSCVREINSVSVLETFPKAGQNVEEGLILLYFFGGGFVVGSPFEDLPILARLSSKLSARCIAPFYRLAPENPFPAALDDVEAVYREICADLGASSIVIAGESAGANLCIGLLHRCRNNGLTMPVGVALMSPWSDLSENGFTTNLPNGFDPTLDYDLYLRSAANAYTANVEVTDPLVSPVYGDYDDKFPPTLITTGTRDLFLSDCARLSTRMRQANVDVRLYVWEGMWHAFEWYSTIPESQESINQIAQFLDSCISRASKLND